MVLVDDFIFIFIGTEPSQRIACAVLKSSIMRRTKRILVFCDSWNDVYGWDELLDSLPKIKQGTDFSMWRWCVPSLMRFSGRAIYIDVDQLLLADIGELYNALQEGYDFAAVCHTEGYWAVNEPIEMAAKRKGWDWLNTPQTSVMVINCERCNWEPKQLVRWVKENPSKNYKRLMQAEWIPRDKIQELTPEWNHFSMVNDKTKLVHFSHVSTQPWRNPKHKLTDLWEQELRAAMELGEVSEKEVDKAIKKSRGKNREKIVLHPYFKKVL